MNAQEILSVYDAMAGLTDQMLAAANASDWDRLVQLETQCAACVRQLKASGSDGPLSGAERARKVDAIRRILAADRKIRDLTQPWMAKLSAMINNTVTERRVARAYGV
jgi:flagellar protein FliT